MAFLPPYLLDAWRLDHGEEDRAKEADALKGWTVSSLAEFFMKFQLDKHYDAALGDSNQAPSLSAMAVGKVLDVLDSSEDLSKDAATIAASLSSTTLRQLVRDPRTTYPVLRHFLNLPQTLAGAKKRRMADIDEAIIENERYTRSRGQKKNADGKYLVNLENLCSILSPLATDLSQPTKATRAATSKPFVFARQHPPKGGLEVLDYWRSKDLSVNSTHDSFAHVFDRITGNILRGLNWDHVMVAGGMALTTLLHVDSSKDNDKAIKDPDIDLYIYGLSVADANRKAEEIHDTWVRNLPASANQRLVVKNSKTINLLSTYPNRRVQIILKLLPSPTDVLLNFDLDACAIGFNGSEVFMLPRCARAIETGYSVFTMDLIWGHHLGDRRASQDSRILKYADRGFGIRFLPSYARTLEEDSLESTLIKSHYPSKPWTELTSEERTEQSRRFVHRDRKPTGDEPGLKTLKRVAYLGFDYPHRFYFGTTPLAISPAQAERQMLAAGCSVASLSIDEAEEEEEDWKAAFEEELAEARRLVQSNNDHRANKQPCEGPLMKLSALDAGASHCGLPDGRRGLGNLELFMRHCSAWTMHSRADGKLDMSQTASLAYDPDSYDDMPTYEWNERFNPSDFEAAIEQANNNIWAHLKVALCGKLGTPQTFTGYAAYSTRRVRRQVCGPDFATVQEKQITIPVIVPWGLENFLLSTIPQDYTDLPQHFKDFPVLIPVHDPVRYSGGNIPSIRDTSSENGNLRFWVITNESMWAGQHRVLDEIAEIMWPMFYWFSQASVNAMSNGIVWHGDTDNSLCLWKLANAFRRRIVLPEVIGNRHDSKSVVMKAGLPTLRETLLFRRWAFDNPRIPGRDPESTQNESDIFEEDAVLYPFPDKLFWDPEDLGTWDEEGIPEWTDDFDEKATTPDRRIGIYYYQA